MHTSTEIDSGDTAWVLVSAALVLLMTPGVALFHGGMVRVRSVVNMMMMSFAAMATIGVVWVLWGYSEAFGESLGGLVGNPFQHLGMSDLLGDRSVVGTVPTMAFAAFQAAFAIIAVALVSGAIADRARFSTWLVFTVVWSTLVYFPVAHWVFAFDGLAAVRGGWITNDLGMIDFAGGTAAHINAGAAGLALALVLGRRVGFGKEPMRPHNLTLVMLGAGLLWFGWFGFNAGSALGAGSVAAVARVNTLAATGAAALAWLSTERIRDGQATSLGAASGIVAGLVAVTPACSSVTPVGAVAIGAPAGVLCALAVALKLRFGVDDSAVLAFSFVATSVIGLALHRLMGFRVAPEVELAGIDLHEHAEAAYDLAPFGGSHTGAAAAYGLVAGAAVLRMPVAGGLPGGAYQRPVAARGRADQVPVVDAGGRVPARGR